MKDREFNLLWEKWIWVRKNDNNREKWSLLDVFERAHEVKEISGELSTQDIVILRLLLAVLYSIFPRKDIEGNQREIRTYDDVFRRWEELWNARQFPFEMIKEYLLQHEDRFWLFHPKYPFYQAVIHGKSTEYFSGKLIGELSESTNKVRLFPLRSGEKKKYIDFDEAARWLLHVNAFDDTSGKPTISKTFPSAGAGWLGQLGLVYIQGVNLFETLVLNFVLCDDQGTIFKDPLSEKKAFWEKEEITSRERVEIPLPESQKELLTLQSRRLELKREGDKVIGYKLLGGDLISKESAFIEQMTLWRKDEKEPIFLPKRHRIDKQVWRDFAFFMASAETADRNPGVVSWIKLLKKKKMYTRKIVKLCVTGIQYGDKDFFVEDVIDDTLHVNSSIFEDDLDENWLFLIANMITKTDNAVYCLGYLATDIATAEGDSGRSKDKRKKEIREITREKGYQQLDMPFREWLLSIDAERDSFTTKENEWNKTAKRILWQEGKKMMDMCSNHAIIGFLDKDKKVVSAVNAYQKFQSGLAKNLGKEG